MNVINLIAATKTNPKLLKDLEKQILEIIKTDDYTSLKQMLETRNLECMFYAAIILEKRIKLIVKVRHRIELFTAFLNYTINEYVKDSCINMFVNKIGDVHALAGIYFYPFFLDIYTVFSLPNLGALFYKKFLFACNTNNEITNDRRIEIRNVTKERNIQMLQCVQCDRLNAIEIYEYALLCIKDGDSLINAVLQIGGEDDETVSFFDTYLNMRNGNQADKIVEFMKTKSLDFLDRMIEIFMGVRKDVLTNINLLVYVCRSFNGSMLHLDYLTLVFKSIKHNDAYEEIALEVMRHMIAMNESDKETKVFELIRIINMHYPKVGAFVIEKYGTSIDAKIVLIMLRSYPKLQLLRFNNLLIECYRLLFIESRDCIKLMGGLDLKDAESCKFVAKATKKFNLDRDTIFVIMNNCKNINSEPSDELFVNCLLELEKYQLQQRDSYVAEFLAGDYTLRKRQRLCILLKKDFELGKGYVPSYFEYYLSTNDVETGFAILGTILKKTDLPQQIYAHLFTNMKSYTLQQMSSFITELLTSMDDQKSVLFFDPIYQKFCVDFETANYIDISLCIKAFGSFLEKKIIAQKNSTFIDTNTETTSIYLNMLINLLNLRDDQAIRKVYEVIKNNKLIVAIDLNYLADIYNTNPNSEILSLMVYILENSENEIKQSFKGGLKNKKDVIKQYLKQDTKVRFIVDKYGVKCDSDPGVDVSKFFE